MCIRDSSSRDPKITLNELKDNLYHIREVLISEHKSLFLDQLDDVINKVNIFGYHFASLDIRQDSRIHSKVFNNVFKKAQKLNLTNFNGDYNSLSVDKKIKILSNLSGDIPLDSFNDDLVVSTLGSIRAMKFIQNSNGEKGSNLSLIHI